MAELLEQESEETPQVATQKAVQPTYKEFNYRAFRAVFMEGDFKDLQVRSSNAYALSVLSWGAGRRPPMHHPPSRFFRLCFGKAHAMSTICLAWRLVNTN